MAGEVNFGDLGKRKLIEVGTRVEAQVDCRDMDIVDIEQQSASRSRNDLRQKRGLAHGAAGVGQIVRRVLEQDPAAEALVDLVDMIAHPRQRGFVTGYGKEIVETVDAVAGPGKVLRNHCRREPRHQMDEALKMFAIERPLGADREADTVA